MSDLERITAWGMAQAQRADAAEAEARAQRVRADVTEGALINARNDALNIRSRLIGLAFNPTDQTIQRCEEIISAVDELVFPGVPF